MKFRVASADCVACAPTFRKRLGAVKGVKRVRPLPMLNEIAVDFTSEASMETIRTEVIRAAREAGLSSGITFV